MDKLLEKLKEMADILLDEDALAEYVKQIAENMGISEWREVWEKYEHIDDYTYVYLRVYWSEERNIAHLNAELRTGGMYFSPPVLGTLLEEVKLFDHYTDAITWGQETWALALKEGRKLRASQLEEAEAKKEAAGERPPREGIKRMSDTISSAFLPKNK